MKALSEMRKKLTAEQRKLVNLLIELAKLFDAYALCAEENEGLKLEIASLTETISELTENACRCGDGGCCAD